MSTERIILLLDESGSMGSQRSDVINGINSMISQQKELLSGNVQFSIVKFNSKITKMRSTSLWNTREFGFSDYNPSGGTALYDAIGDTIDKYLTEKNVIMIIVTDGQENSSTVYTQKLTTRMINKQRNTKNWNFIYLSEDPTTERQGVAIGLSNKLERCSNTVVGKNQCGMVMGSSSLQNYIADVSKGKTTQNYDDWQNWNKNQKIVKKSYTGPNNWLFK